MQVRGHFDFTENYEGNCFGPACICLSPLGESTSVHVHLPIPPQLRVHLGNRRVYVSPISSIKMREIEVPADLHRFPPSVLGLCFPSVLLWKLD